MGEDGLEGGIYIARAAVRYSISAVINLISAFSIAS